MKKEMESLEIAATVRELKELEGGYIQKIYEPMKKTLLFKIHVPDIGSKMLIFFLGDALFITNKEINNPMHPGDYIMLMRKYLGNSRIVKIKQHEFDRVVEVVLQGKKILRLIFEVFGKGNLILVGEEDILLPYRSESWSHRDLKEGEIYKYPPSRVNPFNLKKAEFESILIKSKKDLVRTLAVDLNIGGKYAEEICARLDVDKNTDDYENLTDKIYDIVKDLQVKTFEKNLKPYVVKSNQDEIIDAVPYPLSIYDYLEMIETETYNKALDLAFKLKEKEEDIKRREASSKLKRKLQHQKQAIKQLQKEIEENKIIAELIYQNYKKCEEILNAIHRARDEGRREEIYEKIKNLDYVVQLNDFDEYIVIELQGSKHGKKFQKNVRLDFRKDVNENAQKYYNKSKKSEKKVKGAKKAIEETKKQIEMGKKEKKKETLKPTKKHWFDRYKWFISSSGNLVVAGKDAKTNEEVVKKYLQKGSRYAHAEAGGAPSVVVIDSDKGIDDDTLKEACQYSILHSKEWKRGIAAGRGYWVKPSQVSKTAEAGESLPTGAFVVRGKRNYIDGLPLKAGIAEIDYKGSKKIMCAPSYALEERKDDIVKKKVFFIPGNKNLNKFSKEMSKLFNVPLTEIQKILPPGDVKIIEKEE